MYMLLFRVLHRVPYFEKLRMNKNEIQQKAYSISETGLYPPKVNQYIFLHTFYN